MLKKFANHNLHWQSVELFSEQDPNLRKLKKQSIKVDYHFQDEFPLDLPGIYTLSGGRQLGKTTCLKRTMLQALLKGSIPESVFYLSCDALTDRKELYDVIKTFLEGLTSFPAYLFVDEVTFLADWNLAVKALADEGLLDKVVCCLSGSDQILLEDAITALPGRRGNAEQIDFTLHPLLFSEVLKLFPKEQQSLKNLEKTFALYLQTGGYITAINDFYDQQEVQESTSRIYQQWILGDFIRLRKSRENLLQVLYAIFTSYGSQVSFQSLSQHTDALSKDTVNEYCTLLKRLGVISIQYALDQNKLRAAPRKHKKIHFLDPFIANSLRQLLLSEYQNVPPLDEALLVESICYAHYHRKYSTYYIKADGEVDIAYVANKTFFPVEIKWKKNIRAKDLKQLKKYSNSLILAPIERQVMIDGVSAIPLLPHLAGIECG